MKDFEDQPRENGGLGWMVTFADVLALLLTFFVMLYAMNDIREDEWQGFVTAMNDRFNPAGPPADFQMGEGVSDVSHSRSPGMDLGYLEALLETQLNAGDLSADYTIRRDADGLRITLPEVLAMRDGTLILTPAAETAAREIGQVLRSVRNDVSVGGHARQEAGNALYPSAWELSLAAARMIADTVRAAGYERNILALGHGDAYLGRNDGQAAPAAPANLSWGRVDVVIRDRTSGD